MKNHYIPQFIIKKFSKAINVFNLKTGELRENRQPSKVFFNKDIYDDEIEKSLNINLEADFSNLLNKKLLVEGEKIILTREEVLLVKKYMLVSSVRAQGEEHFRKFLINFKKNTNNFYLFKKLNNMSYDPKLPYTEETNLTDKELLNNAILAFSQAHEISDLAFNKLCTKEMVAYAATFLLSYITFWDAPENNEFVLSDVGMISEYEGIHLITGGLDLSKLGYLKHQILNDQERLAEYVDLMASNSVMYENYDIFNISKTRCLIMVSPFFRQYFGMNCIIGEKKYTIPKPDIWPAIIQNKDLFTPPENKYRIRPLILTQDDLFIYEAKKLNQEELIYINSMLITQSKEIIGFDSSKNIFPSIEFAINQKCHFNSVTESNVDISDKQVFCNYIAHAFKEPLQKLAFWCGNQNTNLKLLDIDVLFEKYINNLLKDFKNNIYIFEYLLNNKENTYNCKELDFLGHGDKNVKMAYIEKEYYRIKEERENAKKIV